MKIKAMMMAAALASTTALSAMPLAASAAEDVVYGTMNIPYADFYAAEVNNTVPVDAVSSATASKWSMNQTGSFAEDGTWTSGGLVAGTYNDGAGKILGVTYPVAISQADLDSLTDKYGFTALDAQPVAYKPVTVTDGVASFGKIEDTDGAETLTGGITLSNTSNYGDYQIQVENIPQNADIYGVVVKTAGGTDYGMRALENIWRNGQIAWGAGCKTTESHGNTLSSAHYESSQGQTINEVTFITLNGYSTLSGQSVYLGIKTVPSLTVENSNAGKGSTTFDNSVLPDDFAASGAVADGFTVSGNTISYENAQPGNYKLTVSDTNGKYSEVTGSFTLTTDDIPVKYADGKLVVADGYTDADAANFLKNINAVTVGENTYKTGRRGVTVIDSTTGEIKMDAVSGETPVFDGSGKYTVSVASTGYNKEYTFEIGAAAETTTASATAAGSTTTTTKFTTTTTKSGSSTTTASGTASPKTADATAALPLAAAAVAAGVGAALTMKKRK